VKLAYAALLVVVVLGGLVDGWRRHRADASAETARRGEVSALESEAARVASAAAAKRRTERLERLRRAVAEQSAASDTADAGLDASRAPSCVELELRHAERYEDDAP
jgi:hypothetical protein